MSQHISNDRRAGTALRQSILKTGNLRDVCRYLFVEREVTVLDEESPNSAEIKRREKILKIKIEDIPATLVWSRVIYYRLPSPKPMCYRPTRVALSQFVATIIKQV